MASPQRLSAEEQLYALGHMIRQRRQARRITLGELARRIGISAATLSLVERGRTNPSIGTLTAVADALGISLADLFGQVRRSSTDPVIRREAQPVFQTRPGVRRRLVVRDERADVELAENSYAPGSSSADLPIRHAGRELGMVLQGRLRVEVGSEVFVLRRGDAILFDSTIPHRFTNVGPGEARTIWVNLFGRREDAATQSPSMSAGR
jgi:transcriptional regulator with XRE-family HTH domain